MAIKPLSVAQVNRYIGRLIQRDALLKEISVQGEISNLKHHHSGHTYFSLKDDQSKINCFLHQRDREKFRYVLEEGMEIIAFGFITTYEKGGTYSLWVKGITVEGEGNLSLAFEKLKEKLKAEGLFDREIKKELPFFPRKIGIITAEGGAAIEDMVKIIESKNQVVKILFYPALVQGDRAAEDLARGIDRLNEVHPELDLIILGRGGGSTEDLWAFNEEILARAIFRSAIPILSAVGHETDVTIADFVADRRGETPTAAAEMAVPDIQALKDHVRGQGVQLEERMALLLEKKEKQVHRYQWQVFHQVLQQRMTALEGRIQHYGQVLQQGMTDKIRVLEQRLTLANHRIQEGNPLAVMERGYGAVADSEGRPIKTIQAVEVGQDIGVTLCDGQLEAQVKKIRSKS